MLQRVVVSLVMLAAIIFGLQFLPSAADGADKCPSITVTGVVDEERNALFSANVTSLNENLTYVWSVSTGMIAKGQGTLQISVAAAAGGSVTATVEVGGVPASCPATASGSVDL